ncbi:MAG: hypothetical protein RQ732_08225 [Methylophaga sp.]|nr:hypothetical protein [Methylophaga sp.]
MRNLLVLLSLEHYLAVTMLFPAMIGFACLAIIINMQVRRKLITASDFVYIVGLAVVIYLKVLQYSSG